MIKKILKKLYRQRCQQGLAGVSRVCKLFCYLVKSLNYLGCLNGEDQIWYLHRKTCPATYLRLFNPAYPRRLRKHLKRERNWTDEEFDYFLQNMSKKMKK